MMTRNRLTLIASCLYLAFSFFSCADKASQPNTLSGRETDEGWQLLFDGKTTNGWHIYNEGNIPSVWSVQNGELTCDPAAKDVAFGDLVTDRSYQDFELTFEWKISKGGNSGVFINVQEDTANATAWTTGPEYQLYDNLNATDHNKDEPKRQAGALYGLVPAQHDAKTKPFGEWNVSRIQQVNGKVMFWLNGVQSAEVDFTSDQWKTLVEGSSLGKFPMFGKATSGKIALQNWAKGVSFRNIKIREINP
ncbi:MAG: DUF1080 domain-containing protein [Chitinophagaceae bacterium]|jgi:hypothetical protein|nr:DUF1080 domain-containing protein [Chitinophagaceae bacterium]